MKLKLYLNTIRYLKFEQIFFRIYFKFYKPRPVLKKNTIYVRNKKNFFLETSKKETCLIDNQTFEFNNVTHEIDTTNWEANDQKKLWQYNLHYFNYLNENNSNLKNKWHEELIISWCATCFSRKNDFGWDPYPTSLRSVNIIKWLLSGNNLDLKYIEILFCHGEYLEKRIERHILGNHIFSNGKALIFLGLYFECIKSKKWLSKGISIVKKQIEEQVLSDGGNFELSPSYHINFLEDILDIINIITVFDIKETREILPKLKYKAKMMLDWLDKMVYKDGSLPAFNDTSTSLSVSYNEIKKYAAKFKFIDKKTNFLPRLGLFHLKDSGYIIINYEEKKLILDVGSIGPNYLMAHSHADTLSFELASGREKIFINSGTSCYENTKRRNFERSTKAHNTVEVRNKNSSNVWSSFRVAERALTKDLKIDYRKENIRVDCTHDGYNNLFNKNNHTRSWFVEEKKITINDFLSGVKSDAVARFILDPGIIIEEAQINKYKIYLRDGSHKILIIKKGIPNLVTWKISKKMGLLEETFCLEVGLVNNESSVVLYEE